MANVRLKKGTLLVEMVNGDYGAMRMRATDGADAFPKISVRMSIEKKNSMNAARMRDRKEKSRVVKKERVE